MNYKVTGMSCAACAARVDKAVRKVEGVTSCSVNLLLGTMQVEGTASVESIIRAVTDAGYGAKLDTPVSALQKSDASKNPAKYDEITRRLIKSLIFLIALMYFTMGHMMPGFPIPSFCKNPIVFGMIEMILTLIVMIINRNFFKNGIKGFVHLAPNMDTLVSLGAFASFGYSFVILVLMCVKYAAGDVIGAGIYLSEMYFESAAMILTLITVGKKLEERSKGRTTNALRALMDLSPKTAEILKDDKEITVPIGDVNVGDVFIIRSGSEVPVDGIVIKGNGSVDESTLTGESVPTDKSEGDIVNAATMVTSGYLTCRATKVGEDTSFAQIIRMVSNAAAGKAPIAKIADKVSGVFVPAVITIAIITIIVWIGKGQSIGFALARGISVLVISCPCALGLATPVAIMVGNGVGAKNGVLFKSAEALEILGKVKTIALDKTGTITNGLPTVTDIIAEDEDKLLKYAYALESKSEHPLAKAVTEYAKEREIPLLATQDFEVFPGGGVVAVLPSEGIRILGGNIRFINDRTGIAVSFETANAADRLSAMGRTLLWFATDREYLGLIAVADTVKDDSIQAIDELNKLGIETVMITGDGEITANVIAKQINIKKVFAGVLPGDKEQIIKELRRAGYTAMVGDGINDAPALTSADIGIAIGAGCDVAIDAADVVLTGSSLMEAVNALRLCRQTLRVIHLNLFWAFFYNVIGIPLAAGCFIKLLGWTLNPMIGAAAMSLSSFCVVTGALSINSFKAIKPRTNSVSDINENKTYNEKSKSEKGDSKMTKTLGIEGMMCNHCKATVEKALGAVDGVESVLVSLEDKNAIVTLSKDVDDETLKKAVEDHDFQVVAVNQ